MSDRSDRISSRGANEMVAYALEAPAELLQFLPELLADLNELGSDAVQIAAAVGDLGLPSTARIVDLGCGKGAVAIEIASQLQMRVVGIDLFEPFVAAATEAARRAGVAHLCEFCHGDIRVLAECTPTADAAVFAALGDVLGSWSETMRVVRQYVRPGGHVIIGDVFLRDGGSRAFNGFEHYRSAAETVQQLTAWGDTLVKAVVALESAAAEDDEDAAAIRRRAIDLAARYPEHREKLLAFADYQAQANTHIAENLVDAVWVLQRNDDGKR
jgi:cyclopropane fatty-acyl-phospholipid synthase-like methyltransferase